MPGYAKRFGELEDGIEVVCKGRGHWCDLGRLRGGRGAKEHEIVDQFDYWMDPCPFQKFNTCICNGTLDATGSSEPFNSDVLNKDVTIPHYGKVRFVDRGDWRVMVSLCNI